MHHFHINQFGTGIEGEGKSVTCEHIRIGGNFIDSAKASCGEDPGDRLARWWVTRRIGVLSDGPLRVRRHETA